MTGTVVAVCTRDTAGLPKYVRLDGVVVTHFGLDDDYHSRETFLASGFPEGVKPNMDRHITVLAKETLDLLNRRLLTSFTAGDLGENILIHGLGDLSEIQNSALISIGGRITLRVTRQNQPDPLLIAYHPQLIQMLRGRNGLRCTVESGVCQKIWPQDEVIMRIPTKSLAHTA